MVDGKNDKKLARFNLWFVMTAFSIVVLAATTSETKNENSKTRAQRWLIAVSSISLSLGALACLAHAFARRRFVGTPIEGGLAVLCLAFWSAGLPRIMDPKQHLAIVQYMQNPDSPEFGYILNANLYYFTWGAFIVSLFLVARFFQEVMEAQWPELSFRRTMMWFGLAAVSCVLLAAGTRTYRLAHCDKTHATAFYNDACQRVKSAVSAGVVGFVLALIMALIAHRNKLLIESLIGVLILIMYGFQVSYITFGSKAPASTVGDVYYSVWLSFTCSLFVGADSMSEYYCKLFGEDESTPASAKETPPANEAEGDVVEKIPEESPTDPAIMEPSNV